MKNTTPTSSRPPRHTALAVAAGLALTVGLPLATAADRSQETNPNWQPSPKRNTETEYGKRFYNGDRTIVPMSPSEVKHAPNPADAAARITETSRHTVPWGLHPYRGDKMPGVGFYQLDVNPLDGSADRSARTLVEQALSGRQLNLDTRSLIYLRNSAKAINQAPVTRTWEWAFGSPKLIRIAGTGTLEASVGAGTASYLAQAKVVGTFFNRTREIAKASVKSSAPAAPNSTKVSVLTVDVLGRSLINDTVTDVKPFVRSKKLELAPFREWWNSGAIGIPWMGLDVTFAVNTHPVTATPRVAIGHANAAGEIAIQSKLECLGEVPILSLWGGFAKIAARIHFDPVNGKLVGGDTIGLVWNSASRPMLRDARFARSEVSYGAVNLKIKATVGFIKVFGWTLWKGKDFTLWSVFKHDGKKSERELFSTVRETPLK